MKVARKKKIKTNELLSDVDYQETRTTLRLLVRSRDNFQEIRKAVDNRIGMKADGTKQNRPEVAISPADKKMLAGIAAAAREQEKTIEESLEEVLNRFSFYTEWLSKVKGVGPNHAAWLIGEIDIRHKAENVSKIYQFAGLNPGMVLGQKSVEKKKYKPEMGEIIGYLPPRKDGERRLRVLTNTPVRGDKKTKDFLCPFNSRFRTSLMGRLATSMIKAEGKYAIEVYYALHVPAHYRDPTKTDTKGVPWVEKRPYLAGQYGRLDLSEKMTTETKKENKIISLPWKDTTEGHREMAAKRKMIKVFLADFYHHWRTIEGLPVRKPYSEEYLGKYHGTTEVEEFDQPSV